MFGEGLALRETLESSLLIGLVVASPPGLLCGLILAQYVRPPGRRDHRGRRRHQRSGSSQRVPLTGAGDGVHRLGGQINAMLDRISALMEVVFSAATDSLAHDLRSPVSRSRSAGSCPAAETGDPKEQEELLGSVIRQSDLADADPDLGVGNQPVRSADRRNQFAWFDAGEFVRQLTEMYSRSPRSRARR